MFKNIFKKRNKQRPVFHPESVLPKPFNDSVMGLSWEITQDMRSLSYRISLRIGEGYYTCIVDDPLNASLQEKLIEAGTSEKTIGIALEEHLEDLIQSGQANDKAVQAYLYLKASSSENSGGTV